MADVDVYQSLKELLQKLFSGDEEVAELAATAPEGLLAAYGLTDAALDGDEFRQAVADTYQDYELPPDSQQALASYVAGGPAPEHYPVHAPASSGDDHPAMEQAVQHLQYVTYASYENNETITREIQQQITVDNSDQRVFDNRTELGLDVGGDLDGDITVAPVPANGDGAVAAGAGSTVTAGDDNQVAALDIDTGGGDGGDASGGFGDRDAAGGDGGDVGPINLNFGEGDQQHTAIDGDLRESAVATGGGDAQTTVVPGGGLFPLEEEVPAEEVGLTADIEAGFDESATPRGGLDTPADEPVVG